MDIKNVLERNFTRITDEYRTFALEKDRCRQCSIYSNYKQVGQSEGNAQNPTFMFVGEALGKDEVQQNRPFIGMAGQLLRKEMRKHKAFKRSNTIISNVLACRPLDNKFPASDKSPNVITCTKNWLFREIKLLRPKVIVTLGNPALKYIRGDWGITANRGKWKFLYKFRAWSFATYHPSYVMRSEKSGKNFVVDQFQNDIKLIATMWHTIAGDYRLSMNDEEWTRMKVMNAAVSLGLTGK